VHSGRGRDRGKHAYAYDLNDRLLAKTDPSGYELAYEYDAVGHRSRLSISNVLDVSYAYDLRNRLAEIDANGKVAQFGYDAAGQRTNAIWPNGTFAAYAYDDAGQLLSLVHGRAGSSNPPIASFAYAYDLSGNRTHMITLEGTNAYAYDARGWLTEATYPDGNSEAFAYDPVGNRIHLGGAGSIPTDYTYGPVNRLLFSESAVETNLYTFDNAGRLVAQTINPAGGGAGGLTRTYAYDFQSRMTSLADTNGSTFTYAFDGEGNRISQTLNDCLTTRFVYDAANAVMEINASNEVVRAYINGQGMDQPIERIAFINGTPRQRQVFHADGLGSIAALSDESGAPIQSYTYAAFGGIRARTDSDLNRVTYTAREALGDSFGFYYYRNRVLDPNTGRFTSEDPLGFVDGANRYVYCANTPVNRRDPWGLCEESSWWNRYKQNYNNTLNDLYGADLEWADTLGLWGLGSLAVEGSLSAYQSLVEYLAAEQIANAQIAGALGGGSMWQRMANAAAGAEVAGRTAALRTGMQAVSRVTAVAGAAATGYSIGARVNAATRAVYQTWQQGGASP